VVCHCNLLKKIVVGNIQFLNLRCPLCIDQVMEAKNELVRENNRLRAGEFTEEEFQNLCHNFTPDDECRFKAGCEMYQRKLFGH
jgi:hypothetical protein